MMHTKVYQHDGMFIKYFANIFYATGTGLLFCYRYLFTTHFLEEFFLGCLRFSGAVS